MPEKQKPKISLCIISRKEDQDGLINALESVYTYVDEIVVVDTTKGEKKLVDEYARGGKNKKLHSEFGLIRYFPYTWNNNFADARNFSFSKAKEDIIFTIDSDDIVRNPENLPLLAQKMADGEIDWVYCEYIYQRDESGNVIAKHWKPRLFKRGSGHWVGAVHEDFMPDRAVVQKKDVDLGPERLIIEHQADQQHLDESPKRNLAIQLAELERDGDKVDPRTIMYTGMSYQSLGEYEKAIPYFARHVKVTGSKEDKYWSLYRISLCFHFLGRNEEALNFALDSLKIYPDWKSSYLLLAAIYHEKEEWPKVIEWTLTGLEKSDPDTLQVLSEIDYTILPLLRLSMAYLHTGNYVLANEMAIDAYQKNPNYPQSKEMVKMCMEAVELEQFVSSFLNVVKNIKLYDRVKAVQLFDLLPKELDEDYRIQHARHVVAIPKNWEKKSVVIYCGRSLEEWAYPSVFTGIGGSEKAVIHMAERLSKLGYKVTVYNRCGNMKGTYDGVEYLPYYFFNKSDNFDTLIVWRNPLVFHDRFNAKHAYLWLHDIAHPEHFNDRIYANIDKIFFLSKWHRTNLPDCPDEKVFITNNGINPKDFETLPLKRPNSLFWGSSYDRGLLPFMKNIWPLIKKEIPDVTLDVAYGWQNIEKEFDIIPELKKLYTELNPLLESTPGVTHHGRIPHKALARLMGECMVYPYASEFGETNNMTSQEAQAASCFVITTSQAGGTPERIRFGKVIKGNDIYTNKELQKKFAKEVIATLRTKLPHIGLPARDEFSWSTTAVQWQKEVL